MITADEECFISWLQVRSDRDDTGKKSLRLSGVFHDAIIGGTRTMKSDGVGLVPGVSATDPVQWRSGWLAVFSLAIGRPLVASSNRVPAAALSVTCCTRCALFASVGRPWLAFLLQGVAFSIGCATVVNEKHNTLNGGKNIWQANQSSHTD